MARSSSIGSEFVVLVLTQREARALDRYLRERVASIYYYDGSSRAAVSRAVGALAAGVRQLEQEPVP